MAEDHDAGQSKPLKRQRYSAIRIGRTISSILLSRGGLLHDTSKIEGLSITSRSSGSDMTARPDRSHVAALLAWLVRAMAIAWPESYYRSFHDKPEMSEVG